jgi:arsenite-transporting ATPase
VMEVMREGNFDRVIVDTAPTGHTLRLLSFPDFLDGFLQKVLGIKRKLDGAINTAKALFGMSGADGGRDEVEEAAAAVERQRVKAVELRELLTDPARTQFLVVSIATQLAFAESERLVQGLAERGVAVDNLVVNQLLGEAANEAWVHRVAKAQGKSLEGIRAMTDQAMLAAPADAGPIWVREVPYFDSELQSVYALRSLAAILFPKAKAPTA